MKTLTPPSRNLIEYKGFFIDEELHEFSVVLTHKEFGIKKVFRTTERAKCYVDGFSDCLNISKTN